MRKLSFLLLLGLAFAGTSSAQVARRLSLGFPGSTNTSSTQALNTATTFMGFSVLQTGTKNISSAKFRVSNVTGTLTNISCELQADASGIPSGTSLETVTITSSFPTTNSTVTFTFAGTTSMTDGSLYWLVLKNNTGTPASNNLTYQYLVGAMPGMSTITTGNAVVSGWMAAKSTDGTTWGTANGSQIGGFLVTYSDSTVNGYPVYSRSGDTTNKTFGSNEAGVQFTSPANVTLNVKGIVLEVGGKVGAPTGILTYKMYFGSSPVLQATTIGLAAVNVSSQDQVLMQQFASSVQIPPNTVVTITEHNGNADSSSNYYELDVLNLLDTTAGTLKAMPYGGVVEAIFNGSTWSTSTALGLPAFDLLLDPTNPFFSQQHSSPIVQ